MSYLKNAWTMAAWDEEVKPGALLARTLLDQKLVFFRDAQGVAHALDDRCPHRFVPLSAGRVCDDGQAIQCAYHGLRFDGSGACTHNPHGNGKVPAAARVRSWPLVERHSILWIWMGDPALAEAARIPDFSALDPAHWHVGKGYLHARANYVLETDNILDLSHIEFLHPGTLGSDAVKHAHTELRQEGQTVWSMRQTENEVMPDFLYQAMGLPPGLRVDRWIDVRWDAPASMLLDAGATPTGRPRSEGRQNFLPHLFTPETATTTHYWFGIAFPKAMGEQGAALARQQTAALRVPFETEDLPMLELQQRALGDTPFWDHHPVLLASDAAAVRARRLLDQLIAAEQGGRAA
ncbi:aromatic ring-hydroxylating dioxygenase subunit alpha [Ideonella livida]|uniref:Aromatic ring-hydroxylating dioxygenase subunit alpha n=1 Tax=Ideonella livida TaxID=2707176 RepID=A0A7C9TJ87_9BURK|nr:aromatic ring-hydroxylating dioxygenase subunit alpha [Ideonella livida]NDY91861.1 aromatic ring-hydroxylating dioxygenase subunit alpha [Ideonella livida]